jgi:hypothetical protein
MALSYWRAIPRSLMAIGSLINVSCSWFTVVRSVRQGLMATLLGNFLRYKRYPVD